MNLCIISDLHCKFQLDINEKSDSALFSNMPRRPVSRNPLASILRLIENESLVDKVDYLLCLGDLGDKADEQGIMSGWLGILEIGNKLNVKQIFGIPGNHDVASRSTQPFSFIRSFHESFPTPNVDQNNSFWNKGYSISNTNGFLILLLNSVHDHTNVNNAQIASLKPECIEDIESELETMDLNDNLIKVCILHHHPVKHSNISHYRDGDSLDNGDILIQSLIKYGFNMLIHGHKHQPRFRTENSLPILGAGSFSSYANLEKLPYRPSFHIVEFKDYGVRGNIKTWEFDVKNGWKVNLNEDFPPIIGFGCMPNLENVADRIATLTNKHGVVRFQEVQNEIPEIVNLTPTTLERLGEILNTNYNIVSYPKFPLRPSIIETK
ncbi:MAG: metallophosphoesterase [Bacteroidia bacterium]|nr:metallophosphoesterase [Bacteroidia bacterium]